MRILIQGLNYAPELVGIGKYTGEMVDFLIENGHEVIIVTTPPYYPMWKIADGYHATRYTKENHGLLTVIRCPLWVPSQVTGMRRIIHLLSYALSAFPVIVKEAFHKPDVIISIAPAFTSAPNAILAGWISRAKTWLHVQDFELDAALNLGMVGSGKAVARLAAAIERFIFRHFDRVSSISHAMVEKLDEKGVEKNRQVFFPNWIDTTKIYPMDHSPMRQTLGYGDDDIVILYSGSMGAKQGLEVLVESARELNHQSKFRFLLCGEGSAKQDLLVAAEGLDSIRFLPLQPYEKFNELLNCTDILVLPQRKDASDLMMPSKLLGMMASGKAIIAGCVLGSELHQVVEQVGLVVEPENVDALTAAIIRLAADPALRQTKGRKARQLVCENYGKEQVLARFETLLKELIYH
ncbi:MAG: glycosyltransferase WbuB [Anaerolineae bacterium]|jgi:colanic acid biosynthesis glycosyl transferase WcaI|nr:glycosyltransferase WbuB [Anaerolineae bacterium]